MISSPDPGRIPPPPPASAVALLSVALLLPTSAWAADASCQPVADAMNRMAATPTHIFTTTTAQWRGGEPRQSEQIWAGGDIYTKVNGHWIRSRVKPGDKADPESREADARHDCRHLRDETVNGEMAAVYATNDESEAYKVSSQVWISKVTGLPLKSEKDTDVGGAAGKSHRSDRYEYGNVRPPKL